MMRNKEREKEPMNLDFAQFINLIILSFDATDVSKALRYNILYFNS
jgi:hypothetical protein